MDVYILIWAGTGLFFIVFLVIFIIHDAISKITNDKGQTSANPQGRTEIQVMIYFNIYFILINMVFLLLRFIFVDIDAFEDYRSDKYCMLITKVGMVLFQLTRTILYLIFVRRIQVIYTGTIFQLKQKYINTLYAMTAIYAISSMSYLIYPALFISKYNQHFGCSISYTAFVYQPILFSVISIMDLLLPICCMYLFLYPLYHLVQHQDDKDTINQLYNLMIKFSILQTTAICSSFLLIIASFFFLFGYYFFMIDALINGGVLILLSPTHNTCYRRICCVFHKLCIKCCNQIVVYKEAKALASQPVHKDIRFRLTKIRVDNHTVQTPIHLLLSNIITNAPEKYASSAQTSEREHLPAPMNMANMYKNASHGQASFIIDISGITKPKYKSTTELSPTSTDNNNIDVLSDSQPPPQFVKHNVGKIDENVSIGIIEGSIRDAMKKKVNEHFNDFNSPLQLNKLNLSQHTSSLQSELSAKCNTLQLINYESYAL